MDTVSIDGRFCGPPASANGGYFAGRLASLSDRTVTVRLLRPPPLGAAMHARERDDGGFELLHGEELIARSFPAELDLRVPGPPPYEAAVEASRHYSGFAHHPFPRCFVCGPERARGDGLRIFPGALAADPQLVAAPWVPDPSLDQGDGKVRPEFIWAALDCPGYFAVSRDGRPMLLAEFTAHADRLVHVDEPCIVIGWKIGSDGRKHAAGTALFDEDGEPCGQARALWIEPAPAAAEAAR